MDEQAAHLVNTADKRKQESKRRFKFPTRLQPYVDKSNVHCTYTATQYTAIKTSAVRCACSSNTTAALRRAGWLILEVVTLKKNTVTFEKPASQKQML